MILENHNLIVFLHGLASMDDESLSSTSQKKAPLPSQPIFILLTAIKPLFFFPIDLISTDSENNNTKFHICI